MTFYHYGTETDDFLLCLHTLFYQIHKVLLQIFIHGVRLKPNVVTKRLMCQIMQNVCHKILQIILNVG